MSAVVHPEALLEQWVPPVAIGRAREIEATVNGAESSREGPSRPGIVVVLGPPGSGSSVVGRWAARRLADRYRALSPDGRVRIAHVPTRLYRSPHGIACALVRSYDEGLDGRGFPWGDLLAGFLRRVRRDGRPTVTVLDDLRLAGPDLLRLIRALGEPERFLPEGDSGLPPFFTILTGTPEGLRLLDREGVGRWARAVTVRLAPYPEERLREIVADRMVRTTDRTAALSKAAEIAHRSFQEGGGARRAIELLRREFGVREPVGEPETPGRSSSARVIEPHLRQALASALSEGSCEVGELRRWEALWAQRAGRPPLATTTFWRRTVDLERRGWLRREVRCGGIGGSRTRLVARRPVEEWITDRSGRETRPDGGIAGPAGVLA
ncbi:MAG: Cdc6/Cdc18 family protein [Thermoplasmata archaeon]